MHIVHAEVDYWQWLRAPTSIRQSSTLLSPDWYTLPPLSGKNGRKKKEKKGKKKKEESPFTSGIQSLSFLAALRGCH